MRTKRILCSVAAIALVAMLVPGSPVTAGTKKTGTAKTSQFTRVDNDSLSKLPVHASKASQKAMRKEVRRLNRAQSTTSYAVGDKRYWLGLDDFEGFYYPKKFKLRYQSKHIELWVATGTDDVSKGLWYPEGDCRNDYPDRIRVTDKQLKYFSNQFENNMLPVESANLSVAPNRGGQDQFMSDVFPELNIKRGAYKDKGAGKRVVTLIDNVRDDQFYDMDDSQDLGRIGGFFSSTLNEVFDRNVMSIDSWNWKYNIKANPPSNPVPGDVCASVVGQPFGYEGTFGHEYQHLLEYYADAAEYSWINEGLSVYTEELLGYSFPAAPITEREWDAFMQCLYGNFDVESEFNPNPKDVGGPENSLTLWGDQDVQDSDEIFCDYGAGGSFIQLLASRFGPGAATYLHNDGTAQGLASIENLLAFEESPLSASDLVHQWNMSLAIDGILDDGGTLSGGTASDYQIGAIDAALDWDDSDAYDFPGAPPNGADYVRARANNGDYVASSDIDSISFDGGEVLAPAEVEWTSENVADHDGPALYSGMGDNLDRAIVREITVPADNATLTFDNLYNMEYLWDYGFVQISDDGGDTWESLSNENTYDTSDPGALPQIIDALPGLTGESGVPDEDELGDPDAATWTTETFDLTPWAGQTVALAFHYITDTAVVQPGWWIDNVMVGGTTVSDGNDINDWQSLTEYNPVEVEGFTVQIVAWNSATGAVSIGEMTLGDGFTGELTGQPLVDVIGTTNDFVGVLVTYDETTELIGQYAPYMLEVNGVLQPGGE